MSRRPDAWLLALSGLSLFFGVLIYLLIRSAPTYFEEYLAYLLGDIFVLELNIEVSRSIYLMWLNSHGADFFWMLSLSLGLFVFLKNLTPVALRITAVSSLAMSIGVALEFFQWVGLMEGTADLFDVITFGLAVGLSIFISERRMFRRINE